MPARSVETNASCVPFRIASVRCRPAISRAQASRSATSTEAAAARSARTASSSAFQSRRRESMTQKEPSTLPSGADSG